MEKELRNQSASGGVLALVGTEPLHEVTGLLHPYGEHGAAEADLHVRRLLSPVSEATCPAT